MTRIDIFTKAGDYEDRCYIGTVTPPAVNGKAIYVADEGFRGKRSPTGEPVNVHDALDDLWIEWRDAVSDPDSDSEFVEWLVAEKGWQEVEGNEQHTFDT